MGMEQDRGSRGTVNASSSRRKTANNLAKDPTKHDWGSLRNLGSFIRRKSSTKSPAQITSLSAKISPRIAAEEKAAGLEKQIAEIRKTTGEEISELELKIASRDAVLRRRAVAMQEAEKKIATLETQLEEAIERETNTSTQTEELKGEWSAKEKMMEMREEEIEKIVSDNKRRPIVGVLRTVILAGSGAVVALATTSKSA